MAMLGDGGPGTAAARFLDDCILFRSLAAIDRADLARAAHRRRVAAGTAIFHAGDPGESLFGILTGAVRIARPASDGEVVIADLVAGQVFGEIAVIDGRGRSADARTLLNSELLIIERRSLLPLLRDRPGFAIAIMTLLCEKLRQADGRASDFLFLDLPTRLAKALLERSAPPSKPAPHEGRVSITQGDLAKVIGASRENVNRQLKEWERFGILTMSRGWIVILERGRLNALADGFETPALRDA